MLIGGNIKLFLNIFFEVFVSTPNILLIHNLPLLFVAEDLLKVIDQDVCYGDCLASIYKISH